MSTDLSIRDEAVNKFFDPGENFEVFTKVVRDIRPSYGELEVYDVSLGVEEDLSMSMMAGKFENGILVEDPIEVVLSKVWFAEYLIEKDVDLPEITL